jgi:hypothetical protein
MMITGRGTDSVRLLGREANNATEREVVAQPLTQQIARTTMSVGWIRDPNNPVNNIAAVEHDQRRVRRAAMLVGVPLCWSACRYVGRRAQQERHVRLVVQ